MKFEVIAIMALSMIGCGDNLISKEKVEEGKMQEAVLSSLKDPDSAKFGKMTRVKDKGACLTVNAKNALGGYTGDQQAYLMKTENKWEVFQIEGGLGHEGCIEIMSSAD